MSSYLQTRVEFAGPCIQGGGISEQKCTCAGGAVELLVCVW